MKAFILGQNSEEFYDEENDINNINSINYLRKNKGMSKSCKVFPENNLIKLKYENEYLNKYINVNKSKNFNMNKNNKKDNKWQKDLKNRIYNNYYNKDIRKKYSNMNSNDSSINAKEKKVKYMDWTEHNSIQDNTISDKNNQTSINSYSNFNIKKKIQKPKNNNYIQENNSRNEINYNNNNVDVNDEEIMNFNLMDDSVGTKSSKGQKTKLEKGENCLNNNNNKNKQHILFEIKLTKEEYNMLLKQKNKKFKNKYKFN